VEIDGLGLEDGARYLVAVRATKQGGVSPDRLSDGVLVHVPAEPEPPDAGTPAGRPEPVWLVGRSCVYLCATPSAPGSDAGLALGSWVWRWRGCVAGPARTGGLAYRSEKSLRPRLRSFGCGGAALRAKPAENSAHGRELGQGAGR